MKTGLIALIDNEARVSHRDIALNTGKKELSIRKLIDSYIDDFKEFGKVSFEMTAIKNTKNLFLIFFTFYTPAHRRKNQFNGTITIIKQKGFIMAQTLGERYDELVAKISKMEEAHSFRKGENEKQNHSINLLYSERDKVLAKIERYGRNYIEGSNTAPRRRGPRIQRGVW